MRSSRILTPARSIDHFPALSVEMQPKFITRSYAEEPLLRSCYLEQRARCFNYSPDFSEKHYHLLCGKGTAINEDSLRSNYWMNTTGCSTEETESEDSRKSEKWIPTIMRLC